MAHIPTQESDIEKVYRIARELGISLEEAADTCDAFHLAFSDEVLKRTIFGMIEQLDESAWKKGEPLGLIIRYTVELGEDGIRVGRYADEIPPGEVVSLTPRDRAEIFLKIKDNFPTQEFLGPVIVNRPELEPVPGAIPTEVDSSAFSRHPSSFQDGVVCTNETDGVVCTDSRTKDSELPSLAKEGCQPASADGVVCSDSRTTDSELPSLVKEGCQPASADGVVCSESRTTDSELPSLAKEGWQPASADGVVCSDCRTTDSELPSLAKEGCQPASADGVVCSSDGITQPAILLGPSSLERAGEPIRLGPIRLKFNERFPFVFAAVSRAKQCGARFLNSSTSTALNARHNLPPWAAMQAGTPAFQSKSAFQLTSGLSPPPTIGERGHSERKMSHCDHSCISGQFSIGGFKKPRMH